LAGAGSDAPLRVAPLGPFHQRDSGGKVARVPAASKATAKLVPAGEPDPEQLVLTLQRATRALQGLLMAYARASGLGLLELLVLSRAASAEGVTPSEAGRALGLGTSTMTGLCDRLEAAKLVRRERHASDRRVVLLKATAKGQRLRQRILGPIIASAAETSSSFRPEERAAAGRYLERMITLMAEHTEEMRQARRPRAARPAAPRRGRRR